MNVQTLVQALKFLFDIAKVIPGLSYLLNFEPVVMDGVTLAVMVEKDVEAFIATPEWADLVAHAKQFFEAKGGSVTTAPGQPHIVTSYVAPPHQSPSDFNLHQGG